MATPIGFFFKSEQSTQSNITLSNLRVNRTVFETVKGEHVTAIECSEFNLLNRYQTEDITPILKQCSSLGFNMLRVWTLYDIPKVGTMKKCPYNLIPSFLDLCASYGLYVEFTAYTGINDPNHWLNLGYVAYLAKIKPLMELVNELNQNENEPDEFGRIFNLSLYNRIPGLLCSHGSNGSQSWPVMPPWDYQTFHTNDADEWWRKAGHNAMEIGGCVLTNENTRYDDREQNLIHAHDAAVGAALLCAGYCYHSIQGKTSDLFTGRQLEAAIETVKGAKSVNLHCQNGSYSHRADLEGPNDLRVYQMALNGQVEIGRIRK